MERKLFRLQDIFRSTLFESLSTGRKAQGPERKISDRITAITAARTP